MNNASPNESGDVESSKKNRPSDSRFKQQKLPAWQPILTAGTVLPTFFVIGIIFIPIGVALLYESDKVHELPIDYTDCNETTSQDKDGNTVIVDTGKPCRDKLNQSSIKPQEDCVCRLTFEIKEDWKGKVYLYYGLTNYYQNHRRYVKSRSDEQLLGNVDTPPLDDCNPFREPKGASKTDGPFYTPCGAIANSLFNDTIIMKKKKSDSDKLYSELVPLSGRGIAWSTDKQKKFKNPAAAEKCAAYSEDPGCWQKAFNSNHTVKPMNWQRPVYELDVDDPSNNGFSNEDLIVWMRTAALPTFRKLYRKINHTTAGYTDGLPKGKYMFEVNYRYPVHMFDGRKRVILSTVSWLGSRNSFLGVAYIVVGSLCICLGLVFLIIHLKFGKSLAELSHISRS